MDSEPDISKIKHEIQDNNIIVEDDSEHYFCVRVKVENDLDWDSMQTVLVRNEYQENYEEKTRYDPKKKYQESICFEELKQETVDRDNNKINNVCFQNGMCQGQISYEELKEDSLQRCMLCGKYFSNSYSFLQHNLVHFKVPLIKRKLFMCEHCPKYYKKKDDLKDHILASHYRTDCYNETPITKQKHKCHICNKTYSYKSWIGHMTEVHCKRKFKCGKCDLSFKAKRYLKRHNMHIHEKVHKETIYKEKHPAEKIKCPKCPALLDSKNALTTHLRNCHSGQKFTCHICKSTLKCKSYLFTHLKRVHSNDGLIHQCEVCKKEFKSRRYLKIHIKNSHSKKIECPKCPALLASKSALNAHVRDCHSHKQYECHICKLTLKCKAYLQTHLKRVHHNDGYTSGRIVGKSLSQIDI